MHIYLLERLRILGGVQLCIDVQRKNGQKKNGKRRKQKKRKKSGKIWVRRKARKVRKKVRKKNNRSRIQAL